MDERRYYEKKVFGLGALALAVFAVTFAYAFLYAPNRETNAAEALSADTRAYEDTSLKPERLIIPALTIDVDVQKVGIGKSGSMAVPTNYADVGWYRYGTSPGELGSAVMTGHVDNGYSLPAVFYRLKALRSGDDIYVVMEDGTRRHFVVTDKEAYAYNKVPVEKIFTGNDRARLNLITCTGDWMSEKEMYDERLVVYAVLKM